MKQPFLLAIYLPTLLIVPSQTCYGKSELAAGAPGKPGDNVPDAKISVDSGYGQYAYVGYYPVSSDSPPPTYRSTSTNSMSLELCSNYCQGSQYFSLTQGDACACGPPVSSGAPTHNPPRSLACSGNDAESCGAPGSAIVYNLQGASGVTINSNSGNSISDSGNDNNSHNGNHSGNDNGNDSGQTSGSKPKNGSSSSSSFGGTPSSSISVTPISSFGGTRSSSFGGTTVSSISVTLSTSTGGTVTAGPPPFPGGPSSAGRSGSAETPPDSTSSASSAAAASASGMKPIPQDEPCLQGDYHRPIKTEASCPGDDFSKATDPYTEATVYNISCRTTLSGDSLSPVHADNFDACLHFCDTYRTCIGVSYVNATGPQSKNCIAYRSFIGCKTAATASHNYIAAAAANGSNYAFNYQSENALCRNATYKMNPYIDPETKYQYKISCGHIYSNTTNLPAASTDSFRGCVAYCAAQAACQGVLFAGRGLMSGDATNCFPYSSAGGRLQKYYSYSVASLIA